MRVYPYVVYVAGPFRGPDAWDIEQNIRQAESLALRVWRKGFPCICPHSNTRFYQGACPDSVWLDGDLHILSRCDALLLTSDWERSEGAREEKRYAESKGIPIFTSLEGLCEHFGNQVRPGEAPV